MKRLQNRKASDLENYKFEIENVIIRNNISFKGGGLSLIRVSGFDLNNIIIEQNNTTINHATYENEGGGLYAG